jgi:hypothetical protein
MRRKQNLDVRQDVPAPSTALRVTEALEQQVRAHPVVQEAMRLFDARIVAITQGAERPAGEQQQLCFSSPGEAGRGVATALHRPPQV